MRALSGAHGRRRTICPCLRSSVCKGNVGLSGPDGIDSRRPSKSKQRPNRKEPTLDSPSPAPTEGCPTNIYTRRPIHAARSVTPGRGAHEPGQGSPLRCRGLQRRVRCRHTPRACAVHAAGLRGSDAIARECSPSKQAERGAAQRRPTCLRNACERDARLGRDLDMRNRIMRTRPEAEPLRAALALLWIARARQS